MRAVEAGGGPTDSGVRGVACSLRGGALLLLFLLALRVGRRSVRGGRRQLRRGRQQLRAAGRLDGVLRTKTEYDLSALLSFLASYGIAAPASEP